tara:strand:+ start:12991 stop:13515 length:525 start_codon:yes stop_codon:yes gene_type:complete
MKNLIVLITLNLLLSACSSKIFKKSQPKNAELDKKAQEQDYKREVKSWSDDYYVSTMLTVKRPLIKENAKEVFSICQGKDIAFSRGYNANQISPVKFKQKQLTFYTSDGFKMKVFVTKGICREIALLKSQLKDNEKSFRKSIAQINIQYIYNGDVYATEMLLDTQYPSVKFTVK